MLSQDDSRALYITGGQGGPGGQGQPDGIGGPGGAGLGPTVNFNVQQLIAHNLHAGPTSQQAFQPSNIQAYQIVNHCAPPSRIFQGRRAILDKMHHFFKSNNGIQNIYVLHGLGGAGKTQIALKFIQESSCFSNIFFIDTSTVATIDTGLRNIAVMKDSGNSQQDGLLWLTSTVEEWLLFFDNADDPNIDLNGFLPQCNHGNIIITSRNPGLCVYAGTHSIVSDMEEKDAAALLLKSAAQEATIHTEEIAMEIVKALFFLPLAIVQADLGSYLTLYTKNQAQLLREKPAQSHDRYAWTVYTTWQMSFDRLTQPAAMFLQHCSFLHYNGISEEIFSYASKYRFQFNGPSKEELQEPLEFLSHFLGPTGEWDSLQFSNITNEVQAYSLMDLDTERKLFSVHPLVHAWSQTTVCNPGKYRSTIGSILGMSLSQRQSLAMCAHVELAVEMDTEVALVFREQYRFIFGEAGKYQQSEKLLEEVLEKQKQLLGNNHQDTLCTMSNLAITYIELGEHQKAKELNFTVLEKQKQLLGDKHPDTLHTLVNLATTYSGLGEHQKAKKLNFAVLEKRKQLLGDDHSDTLLIMGNLANTYSYLGEHQKAKELKVTVLEKQKQLLGDNHPGTLYTMGNLANTYSDLGEHQKAKELYVTVLEKSKRVLGDNHPHTQRTMGNLSSTYSCLGEHQKAEELHVTVLEKQKQRLGDNHPDTLRTMGNLATTYSYVGEHQKAKELIAEELNATVQQKQKQIPRPPHSSSLHASLPHPLPLPPPNTPSSLPPHRLGRGFKKQIASAAAVPSPVYEKKVTKRHALEDTTRPHWR
ncbi:hypothetical protein K438DRAFT_1826906 [Mycena galopus ATCC 62051]|nr:hypothetical protein K438DRAFT_1826906 [Mycena galopus ATCC 62051]